MGNDAECDCKGQRLERDAVQHGISVRQVRSVHMAVQGHSERHSSCTKRTCVFVDKRQLCRERQLAGIADPGLV